MAAIRPFRALRYAADRFPDLAPLLAPPYDIISAQEQRTLYQRHPYNVIRLEYGMQTPEDTPEDNRYARARQALTEWLAEGTLRMDATPGFYLHQQRFSWQGQRLVRNGIAAGVRLEPFGAGDVLPHELTMKGPREDRLKLMRACLASFSPVLALYDGRDTPISDILGEAAAGPPLASGVGFEFDEALWRIETPAACEAISRALRDRKILIADGHHRYETLLALRDALREAYPEAPENAAFNYAFMLLVDLHDPGLLVLPSYRLLLLEPEMKAAFCRLAGVGFRLERIAVEDPLQIPDILTRHADQHAFIWYADGIYTLLVSQKGRGGDLPALDVVVLHERIIKPLLALDAEGKAEVEQNVRYTADPRDAVARVDSDEAQGALFLNPTPVAEVLTRAQRGIREPQKSTYFYPKAATGMVMFSLHPEVTVG